MTIKKMQLETKNKHWTPVVYATIESVTGSLPRNRYKTVYRLQAREINATQQGTLDAQQLCPRGEYLTVGRCQKAAEKMGWTA